MSARKAKPRMPASEAPTILVGLGCGIAFIALITLMLDSYGNHFPTTPSQFLRIASKLPETQEFLSNYASTNTTVYLRDIVEYSFQDAEGKYVGLRISLDRNGGNPSFMQVNCVVIGNELDTVEMHGSKLEGITEFLQNERCPETTYLVD